VSGLHGPPAAVLFRRAALELERGRRLFGLPRRSFWTGAAGLDLSIALPGGRAATPLGPAAGPHTQLANNLVVAWLAGARVLELKTVQVNDRLEIPRPCIDAEDVGYNVEWSQELTLEDSARQYAWGWLLIHALHARGLAGDPAAPPDTRFEASVGYDLAGVRSPGVTRFLERMTDARALLAEARAAVDPRDRALAAVEAPARIVDGVTLSTFHGCPPEEIERIAEHLMQAHGLHVVLKLNPTLLGFEAIETLVRGRLGYAEVTLDRAAFDADLGWDAALGLFERLGGTAARLGLTLGAKFTNTLVVRNTRGVLAGDAVYLSGAPLHPVAVTLAARFAAATGGRFPLSFSAGLTAENVADTLACGFAPVTTCTDLLRPTGYRRLPRVLKALAAALERAGVASLPAFVLARAGHDRARTGDPGAVRAAALANLAAYAARVADDPAYAAAAHRGTVPKRGTLGMIDCASCNNCVLVCPNGAFLSGAAAPLAVDAPELVVAGGVVEARPARFEAAATDQWLLVADLCNLCGNCKTFCEHHGRPARTKPRLHTAPERFAADPLDAMLVEDGGARWTARFGGATCTVTFDAAGDVRVDDGAIEATLDAAHRVIAARALPGAAEGHALPLWRVHAVRRAREALAAGTDWVSVALAVAHPAPGS
jgi:putative selenate reductase